MALLLPSVAYSQNYDNCQIEKWRGMMRDPVYDMLKGRPKKRSCEVCISIATVINNKQKKGDSHEN